MPRKLLKRLLPDPRAFHARRELRYFGRLLEDPFLFHLNRRSVAGACALGLFVAFIPIPAQMLLSAALAILLRVNLVLSVMMVWITNPITMPAIFYFCYLVGAQLTGASASAVPFEPSIEWFWQELGWIWQPFLLGCFLVGSVASASAYGLVQLVWRLHVVRSLRKRKARRESRETGD
jgi:uncharacterized protein (DUF2062 family)